MSAQNPLIDELCKGTHHSMRAAYSFSYTLDGEEYKTFYIYSGSGVQQDESKEYFPEGLDNL